MLRKHTAGITANRSPQTDAFSQGDVYRGLSSGCVDAHAERNRRSDRGEMRNVDELSTCSGAHGKQLVDQLFMVSDNGGNAYRTERLVHLYTG